MSDNDKQDEVHHGNVITPEELAEYEAAFSEIDESIGLVMENGEDL